MPFDQTGFETETKPDVFSLEGLIAWLETQDPETEYDWWNVRDCLLCRYGNASMGTNVYHLLDTDAIEPLVAKPEPWTYGAALARARKLDRS